MSNNLITVKGSKILIVDDKQENLELLTQILESEGFEIAFATNGEQAIQIATIFLPALILLDVMMPGIDGYETCRRLKSLSGLKEIPVIFVTGKANINDVVEAYNV
jgi:two-component system NtrC family sensor kinase